jgi:hypothetical protein
MSHLKAMYRRGNILARTISGMFARAGFGAVFVNLFSSNFVVGLALIIQTYLRN